MSNHEFINRVELAGRVGSIRVQSVSGAKMARLSLATEAVFRDKSGETIVQTDWHSVTVWEGRFIDSLDAIAPGSIVHITGRLRTTAYVSPDGSEHRATEVLANTLTIE